MKIRLPLELEQAIIRAVMEGVLHAWQIKPKEFSSTGETIFASLKHYVDKGGPLPVSIDVVKGYVEQGGRVNPEDMEYFTGLRKAPVGRGLDKVLDLARKKQTLSYLIDAAGEQMSEGEFDSGTLNRIMSQYESSQSFEPLGANLDSVIPAPPVGVELKSFPALTKATGGLVGFWIVGGEPGLGKSTFSWQLGIEYARDTDRKVVYYDIDATGESWLKYRTWMMFDKDMKWTKERLSRVYYRSSIRFLEDDMRRIPPPALIVVDSLQTLPTRAGQRRESLDRWLVRLKDKVNQGYDVLAVSEKNREAYDKQPSMQAYKETGEIEYACSVGLMMRGDPELVNSEIDLYIVKNRHGTKRGRVCQISRDKDRVWAYKEGR